MTAKLEGTQSLINAFAKIISGINSAASMRMLGGFAIKTIRDRTRGRGKGVASAGGAQVTLKKVTDKYAKWRQTQRRHPKAATGKSSNLTFSGKMLDSMIVKNATKSQLFLGFRSQREADKAGWQSEQGRPFFFLSQKEIRDAAAFVKRNLTAR